MHGKGAASLIQRGSSESPGQTACRLCIRSSERSSPAACGVRYLYQRSWTSWCDVMWQVIRCGLLPPLDDRTEQKKRFCKSAVECLCWVVEELTGQMFPTAFQFIPHVKSHGTSSEVHRTPCQKWIKGGSDLRSQQPPHNIRTLGKSVRF